MKKFLYSFLILFGGCCANAPKTTLNQSNMKDAQNKPMTCKLTSQELQKRKTTIISQLKAMVLEKKELPDGFGYKFQGTDELLDSLTIFIKSERMCCDFFNFKLSVNNDSFIWLEISGANGAKEFIITELGM